MLSDNEVVEYLLKGDPISIVRYGDGECIMLNALYSIHSFRVASESVLHRQMGVHPTVKEVEEIRENLIEAYSHADIIGIPAHKQKTSSHWEKAVEILDANVLKRTQLVCDIDVGYHMLDTDHYNTLLQDRKVLNYISCRDLDDGFKRKWNIGVVNKYTIKPEMKFSSGYEGDTHYPAQFNRIPRWLDVMAKDWPGSLLLVGAGVIGKIYCNWWRDRGGVAFDAGGVFDIWAGKITRGPNRGLDVDDPDTKYKIV